MSALSSVLIGGLVLLLVMMSSVQLLMMVRNEAATLNELQRISRTEEMRGVWINGLKLKNNTAWLNVSFTGESISLRDMRDSDVYVGCVSRENSSRLFLTSYGSDWRLADVSLMGGVEILNPSSPGTMSGWIDPGEVATIEVKVPDDCDLSRPMVFVFVSPTGEVGVVSGHGGD